MKFWKVSEIYFEKRVVALWVNHAHLEGVVLSAGASTTVVSLWNDDGNTTSLMDHMYTQIVYDNMVPEELILCLTLFNTADGLPETWNQSYHRLDGLCCW